MKIEAVVSSLHDQAMTDVAAIDLDAAANTPSTPGVIAAVVAAMSERHGNPSSGHGRGDAGRAILAHARDAVAGLVSGAVDEGVVFTSGCTEANNLVLASLARQGVRIITSATEHPSVLTTAKRIEALGGAVTILPVDRNGRVDLGALEQALCASEDACLVSIQVANSETGVVQDIAAIADYVSRRPRVYFHADAAQAFGKVDIQLGRGVGPDVITMSGHKLHAPMGIGALILADDTSIPLDAVTTGGEQEQGLRAGTQAVPMIAGLGAACREWALDMTERRGDLGALQRHLETGLTAIPGVTINGAGASRLPSVSSVTIAGCDAMALVANLDAQGVRVSQGSACSSQRPEPSHVLRAMGLDEATAFATIRISLSVHNTRPQLDRAIPLIATLAAQSRGIA